jgi:hypothetical protein
VTPARWAYAFQVLNAYHPHATVVLGHWEVLVEVPAPTQRDERAVHLEGAGWVWDAEFQHWYLNL